MTTGKKSEDKPVHRSAQGRSKKNVKAGPLAEPVPVTAVSGEPAQKKAPVRTLVIPKPHPDEPVHTGKAGRPFWSGSITIGLVNVPVRLHTMVRDRSFSFRLLHREDGQPLRYDRVCTKDGRVVPWADTVKGYEVRKGEYVVFEPEELKAVMPESDRKIRIEKFVYYLSLDPIYFETPYILVPDRSEEAYSLLVTALQEIGRAAVGTITLRTKEYPVVVHVYGGGLVLTTLRHADEVTTPHAFEELASLPGSQGESSLPWQNVSLLSSQEISPSRITPTITRKQSWVSLKRSLPGKRSCGKNPTLKKQKSSCRPYRRPLPRLAKNNIFYVAMKSRYRPMLARPSAGPFNSDDWFFEIKWDGVRAIAYVNDTLSLKSRNDWELRGQFPELGELVTLAPGHGA